MASSRAEFLAIHGRRRVGMTFLIRSFFSPRARMFEVTGRHGASTGDNLRVFADAMTDTFHLREAASAPTSWHEAFRALRRELERR